MTLSGTVLNHAVPIGKARATLTIGESFDDLMRAYSPYGQVRTISAPFRPGIGIGGYSGAADPFSLDHVLARQLGLTGFQAGLDRQIYGGGKGLELYDMVASSVGEAVERMLGSFASLGEAAGNRGRLASYDEMCSDGLTCLSPQDLEFFRHEDYDQIGFVWKRWLPSSRVFWIPGTNLLTDDEVWVPAQIAHLFHLMHAGEVPVAMSSSGGLATHVNRELAIHHAILELAERDAINLRWFCRMPPARIEIDRPYADPLIARWMESARRARLNVELFHQSVDVDELSVITAVAWDDDLDEWSYFAGGGVGFHIEEAIRSALAELVQSERMIRIPTLAPNWDVSWGIRRMFGSAADLEPEQFSNFIQVVPYYGHRQNREKLDWYFCRDDQPTVPLSALSHAGDAPATGGATGAVEYAAALELCRRHGLRPIAFDFTPRMFSNISLVKVVIPELVPAFAPNAPLLGHRRYREVPQRLGYRDGDMHPSEFTRDPLPYP